jgi:hypothetical protein
MNTYNGTTTQSWPSANNDGNAKGSDFMRLKSGPNDLTLMSAPHQRPTHRIEKEDGSFRTIGCSNGEGVCPACNRFGEPRLTWLVIVEEKGSGHQQILECGQALAIALGQLQKQHGDLKGSLIRITYDPKANPKDKYKATKLSSEGAELAVAGEEMMQRLKRLVTPPTPESLIDLLKRLDPTGTARKTTFPAALPREFRNDEEV